jgi:hypothetical protein
VTEQKLTEELRAATEVLRMALHAQSNEQRALTLWRANDLKRAQDEYAVTITGATMEAYARGVLTGKNQTERDVQLAAFLATCNDVRETAEDVRRAELTMANMEANLERALANCKAAAYTFHAVRAIVDLRTAELNALAGQVPAQEIP